MIHACVPMVLLSLMFNQALAYSYQDEVQNALKQLQQSKNIMSEFDAQSLPNFEANPKEQAYFPSQKGALEQRGRQFITEDKEAQYLGTLAEVSKEPILDHEQKEKGRSLLEHTLNDEVACQDGSCIQTTPDESHDFSEGAVQMAALNGVAEETRDNQAHDGETAIFKATNLTCRVVYKLNRFNYCNANHDGYGASDEEKQLHQAQRDGRAVSVASDLYCSEFKKILGHKTCVQKRQSWCVFQSKLATRVQVEARRQLGIGFGFVGGDANHADCRGLSPKEISVVQFDTPQMQAALRELAEVFESKKQLPQHDDLTRRTSEQVQELQGGGYE